MITAANRKEFLEAIFGEYISIADGFVRVLTVRQADQKTSIRYFPTLDSLTKEQYPDSQHVYFGVCPYENMKPKKTNIQYVLALWAGLDLAPEGFSGRENFFEDKSQAAKAVRSFPIAPSMVVESGWGIHLYWLLRGVNEITNVEKLEKLLERINAYFRCKREIGIDSMMRLPDTYNCKLQSDVVKCGVKYINTELRYDLKEFEMKKWVGVPPSPSRELSPSSVVEEEPPTPVTSVHTEEDDLGFEIEWPASLPEQETYGLDESLRQESRVAQTKQPSVVLSERVQSYSEVVEIIADEIPPPPSKPVYAMIPEEEAETLVVVAEPPSDPGIMADEIAEKVVERLSAQFMEQFADQIAEKLFQKIVTTLGKK